MCPLRCTRFSILKRRGDGGIRFVVVATGIASVAVQLVFVREYLALFKGNEIVIALIFFFWLVSGGLGTLAAKWFQGGTATASPKILAFFSYLLAIFAVCQVSAIRQLRDVIFSHGTSVGFYATVGFVASTILPYALIVGFVLPYSLMVARQRFKDYPGNWIYMADNAGDVAGGVLFSFVLVHWLSPYQTLLIVHLPLMLALWWLASASSIQNAVACVLALVALLTGVLFEERLLPTRPGQRVHYAESRYGRIEVFDDEGEISIFTDGSPSFFSNNPALAEEVVHFPLSQVDQPRRLLLISTVGGIMEEIAKYHPERVDYLEIDPMVARMQLLFGTMASMEELVVISQDARAYLADTSVCYDAILVCLPEPETFQVNRFYTDGFFELAKAHLVPGGVLSFGMAGVANYISESKREKLSSLANAAKYVFKHVMIIPGRRLFFMCRDMPIRTDVPALLEEKGIETHYIRSYYIGDQTDQRIRQVNNAVDANVDPNRDLSPKFMQQVFVDWFSLHGESPKGFILTLTAMIIVYLFQLSRSQWILFTTGCVNMGAEMVTIFAFQMLYGYIYLQVGVLVTLFLTGLLPGAYIGGRFGGDRRKGLMVMDLLLCLMFLGFFLILLCIRQSVPVVVFYGFGLAVSFCCGFQFPLALRVSGDSTTAAAHSFSADLVGAAFGVLLVSLVLIPFAGVLWATLCLAFIKLTSCFIAGTIHETT